MSKKIKDAAGFKKIRGKTIAKVDNRACNIVYLTDSEGQRYSIEADCTFIGIPVLRLRKEEQK